MFDLERGLLLGAFFLLKFVCKSEEKSYPKFMARRPSSLTIRRNPQTNLANKNIPISDIKTKKSKEKSQAQSALRKSLLSLASAHLPQLDRRWFRAKLTNYLTMTLDELKIETKRPELEAIDRWIIRIIVTGIVDADKNKLEFFIEHMFGKIPESVQLSPGSESSWSEVVTTITTQTPKKISHGISETAVESQPIEVRSAESS